jgi:uncharacterized membrane protein
VLTATCGSHECTALRAAATPVAFVAGTPGLLVGADLLRLARSSAWKPAW